MWIHIGSRAFIAGTNQRKSKTEERLQSAECLSSQNENPASVRINYPLFYSSISTCTQNQQFWKPDAIGYIPHKELSKHEASQYEFTLEGSAADHLFTFRELEVLGTPHKHSAKVDYINDLTLNTCSLSFDQNGCRCNLCLNKIKAINSSVSKAKQFIDEAVHNSCASEYPDIVHSFKRKYQFYLLNLAHLVLVIACLRGLI